MYEIYVLGMGLVGAEELAGGWQLYLRTNTESFARETYELLEESFDAWRDENVAWYVDGELTEYDWDEYDPYEDYKYNTPCDTYGMCACSSSCPQFYECH